MMKNSSHKSNGERNWLATLSLGSDYWFVYKQKGSDGVFLEWIGIHHRDLYLNYRFISFELSFVSNQNMTCMYLSKSHKTIRCMHCLTMSYQGKLI
jgi:hypothetical protein